MGFNQYMAHAVREERIRYLMQQKYLAVATGRGRDSHLRESREDAIRDARNQQLPRFDFASVKRSRILNPRVS